MQRKAQDNGTIRGRLELCQHAHRNHMGESDWRHSFLGITMPGTIFNHGILFRPGTKSSQGKKRTQSEEYVWQNQKRKEDRRGNGCGEGEELSNNKIPSCCGC